MIKNTLETLLQDQFNLIRGSTRLGPEECLEFLLDWIFNRNIKELDLYISPEVSELFQNLQKANFSVSVEHELEKSFLKNRELFSNNYAGEGFNKFIAKVLRGHLGGLYSPPGLGQFITEIISPKHEDLAIDPFCGSGNFLTPLYTRGADIVGADISALACKITFLNYYFSNGKTSEVYNENVFEKDPRFWREHFEIVVSHLPYGIRESQTYENEQRFSLAKYYPKDIIAFGMEYCLNLLTPGGKMAIVVPSNILDSSKFKTLRTYFETKAQLVFVVKIPSELFIPLGTATSNSILFFRKFHASEVPVDWSDHDPKKIDSLLKNKLNYKVASAELLLKDSEENRFEKIIANDKELIEQFTRFRRKNEIW